MIARKGKKTIPVLLNSYNWTLGSPLPPQQRGRGKKCRLGYLHISSKGQEVTKNENVMIASMSIKGANFGMLSSL